MNESQRRVVVTGIGVVSPVGHDLNTFWNAVQHGVSGADKITRFDASDLPVQFAAEVRNFSLSNYIDNKKANRFDRTIQYSIAAASMAAQDAMLDFASLDPDRSGIVEGTTISGSESIIKSTQTFLRSSNYRNLHPYNIVAGYCGEGSSTVGLILGIRGHAVTYCSGCASGNDAIGHAMSNIQNDEVDIMIAGGAEQIVEMLHVGFCKLRSMTRRNATPQQSMRPFDINRDGFLLGEGSTFLILEELSHALARGARIYAELMAHGRSNEAYHPTDPHPEGLGYCTSISKAIRRGRVDLRELDYVNAHGSATPLNDPIETHALKTSLGSHANRIAVSATKPITGHLMGASGAIEAAITILAIHHGVIPPTINLEADDPRCDLDYVPRRARPYPIRVALNINAGFGGRYGCLVFRKYPPTR